MSDIDDIDDIDESDGIEDDRPAECKSMVLVSVLNGDTLVETSDY
ncbi:hypothetical protein [Rubripirellula reticaptiva]|nr:hypothetical protein [Rubripirellula reticaptiva]